MGQTSFVTGAPAILQNIKLYKKQLAVGVSRGLFKAGLALQRESQRIVPVDTGALKASAFTSAKGSGFGTVVTVGYTADYALNVHERVEMSWRGLKRRHWRDGRPPQGRYWDPQGIGQAKFLEEPSRRMVPELRKIIQQETGIKQVTITRLR